MKKTNKKKNNNLLLTVLATTITVCSIVALFNEQIEQKIVDSRTSYHMPTATPLPIPAQQQPVDDNFLDLISHLESQPVYATLTRKFTDTEFPLRWKLENNYGVTVADQNFQAIGLYLDSKSYNSLPDPNSTVRKLLDEIDQFFIRDGFTLNKRNTSTSYSEIDTYNYVRGYEKGNSKCVVEVTPENRQFINENKEFEFYKNVLITCTSAPLDNYLREQKPFLDALYTLEPKLKGNSFLSVEQINAESAIIEFGVRGRGMTGYLMKNANQWKIYHQSEGPTICWILRQYRFPDDLEVKCIDTGSLEPVRYSLQPLE